MGRGRSCARSACALEGGDGERFATRSGSSRRSGRGSSQPLIWARSVPDFDTIAPSTAACHALPQGADVATRYACRCWERRRWAGVGAAPGRPVLSRAATRAIRDAIRVVSSIWAPSPAGRVRQRALEVAGRVLGFVRRASSSSSAISSGVWESPLSSSSRRSSSGSRLRRCCSAARRRCSGISESATPVGATSTVEPS